MAAETFSREETEGGVVFRAASGAGTIEVTRNGIAIRLRNMTSTEAAEMPSVLAFVLNDYRRLKRMKDAAKTAAAEVEDRADGNDTGA